MTQEIRNWASVRIPAELIEPIEELAKIMKDEFGVPKFSGKSAVVTEADKEYLRKHLPKEAV